MYFVDSLGSSHLARPAPPTQGTSLGRVTKLPILGTIGPNMPTDIR
jgi:hypothetical protein